jgi:hypothetical protein
MKQAMIQAALSLALALAVGACNSADGQTVAQPGLQSVEQAGKLSDAMHEDAYCALAGQCRGRAGSTCCSGSVQMTHTSCSNGKCCRPRDSACRSGANQCCYPNNCTNNPDWGWICEP